jgi:hypothetical protein
MQEGLDAAEAPQYRVTYDAFNKRAPQDSAALKDFVSDVCRSLGAAAGPVHAQGNLLSTRMNQSFRVAFGGLETLQAVQPGQVGLIAGRSRFKGAGGGEVAWGAAERAPPSTADCFSGCQ